MNTVELKYGKEKVAINLQGAKSVATFSFQYFNSTALIFKIGTEHF